MQIKRTLEFWWSRSKIQVSGPSFWGHGGLEASTHIYRLALGEVSFLWHKSLSLCSNFPPCPLERKTVPLFPHPPVPSLLTSESKPPPQPSPPTSPVRTPLEVRLFPQLQTYVPYRPHPPQLRKVTSPLQSPTKTKPKVVSIDDQELSATVFSLGDVCLSLSSGQLLLEEKLLGRPGETELSYEQLRSSCALDSQNWQRP